MSRIRTTIDTVIDFDRRFPDATESYETVSSTKRYYILTAPCGCRREDPQRKIDERGPWIHLADGRTYECDQHAPDDDDDDADDRYEIGSRR